MCDPISITLAVGALVTAGSQVYGGIAANQEGKYEQGVANLNAKLEEGKRSDAQQRGSLEQMRHWRQVAQRQSAQRAQLAASGVDVNFGSAFDVQEDTAMIGGEDSAIIEQNTTNEVRGYDINAMNYRTQGKAARFRGKSALFGSALAATGTLLSGASQVAKQRAG